MNTQGRIRIDPVTLAGGGDLGEVELVVPYADTALTRAVLARSAALTAGLHVRISLIAVHTVPYPSDFICPTATHSFLVGRLMELAADCPLPVDPQVVLARTREDGFRHALRAESTVVVGTRRSLWRTTEERLARSLAADGHKVVLVHVE
jgi:hypothetical protein